MRLSDDQIDAFASVSIAWLGTGRLEQEAMRWLGEARTAAIAKVSLAGGSPLAVARALIAELNQSGAACDLADLLIQDTTATPVFKRTVAPLARSAHADLATQEALLSQRQYFMTGGELRAILDEVEPRICCIVGLVEENGQSKPTQATGILVGPDLVLSSSHTFRRYFDAETLHEVPDRFVAVFDHVVGENLKDPATIPPGAPVQKVEFSRHPHWLVCSSPDVTWAGTVETPNAMQLDALRAGLDFVLIRLAEPVGRQPPPSRPGGNPRGWMTMDRPSRLDFENDARIWIPQHPDGSPIRYSNGRINHRCGSGTRVLSVHSNTMKGSSGAPCVSPATKLVGVHSGKFAPNGVDKANQAIRLDAILDHPCLQALLQPPAPLPQGPWRVASKPGTYAPIFGRTVLRRWLQALRGTGHPDGAAPPSRAFAAIGTGRHVGRSFTAEIVKAALADRRDHRVVVFSSATQLLPQRLDALVAALGEPLGIKAAALAAAPVRPGPDLPEHSADGDKPDRWSSTDMPQWFLGALQEGRVTGVNRSEEARLLVADAQRLAAARAGIAGEGPAPSEAVRASAEGEAPTPSEAVRALADAPDDIVEQVEAWRGAVVVMDDFRADALSSEVRGFLAALVGSRPLEGAAALRDRIHWVFCGAAPDFVQPTELTTDALEPVLLQEDVGAALASAMLELDLPEQDTKTLAAAVALLAQYDIVDGSVGLLQAGQNRVSAILTKMTTDARGGRA